MQDLKDFQNKLAGFSAHVSFLTVSRAKGELDVVVYGLHLLGIIERVSDILNSVMNVIIIWCKS